MKQFFYERNVPYSEISNLEILVYPIMISQNELQVFSQNKFFEEWNLNKDFENINFILPVENIEDIDLSLSRMISNNDYLMIKGSNATGLYDFSKKMIKGI